MSRTDVSRSVDVPGLVRTDVFCGGLRRTVQGWGARTGAQRWAPADDTRGDVAQTDEAVADGTGAAVARA
ncbi:hypothetical protein [Streptomyces sp. NBC_01320]|uniref:hypothetical protein n=1 Tax=Streptomyces sp. NBC_01320 TaxID=2903824 RepID=UPI002E107FE5|nr:hypothetical protein OG395_31540 [Streptomyces sp. NBC_01320]